MSDNLFQIQNNTITFKRETNCPKCQKLYKEFKKINSDFIFFVCQSCLPTTLNECQKLQIQKVDFMIDN